MVATTQALISALRLVNVSALRLSKRHRTARLLGLLSKNGVKCARKRSRPVDHARLADPPSKRRQLTSKLEEASHEISSQTATGGREAISGIASDGTTSVLLFYQYVDPLWTAEEHKNALEWARKSGTRLGLGGRMRIAREGFNCTLTGKWNNIRRWCKELRTFSHHFSQTEFKITDGLPLAQAWQDLDVIQADEIVGYGLGGEFAPRLVQGGVHLEPEEYHKKLMDPNTVVIDVRNSYEADIGHFRPQGGAEYIDPKMRRSTDWSAWVTSPETQEKIKGKQVMMFCTGGIRCERASSLLSHQMGDQLKGIYQLQGGIDKYLKAFPKGGHWIGKNYVFDKRWNQGTEAQKETKILGTCLACSCAWEDYRQQKRCPTCGIPILVCADCCERGTVERISSLQCRLCNEQQVKNKASQRQQEQQRNKTAAQNVRKLLGILPAVSEASMGSNHSNPTGCTRLFVGGLEKKEVSEAKMVDTFRNVTHIQWLKDKDTGKFYGSCFLEMKSAEDAAQAVAMNGTQLWGRQVKVKYAPMEQVGRWPPYGTAIGSGAGPNSAGELGPPPFPKCRKFFIRGVAPQATDEHIAEFFAPHRVQTARWMTHRDTGEFRGCGHIEFKTPDDAKAAAKMHGKKLLGKKVLLDWAA